MAQSQEWLEEAAIKEIKKNVTNSEIWEICFPPPPPPIGETPQVFFVSQIWWCFLLTSGAATSFAVDWCLTKAFSSWASSQIRMRIHCQANHMRAELPWWIHYNAPLRVMNLWRNNISCIIFYVSFKFVWFTKTSTRWQRVKFEPKLTSS